jgi:hypothetical protein
MSDIGNHDGSESAGSEDSQLQQAGQASWRWPQRHLKAQPHPHAQQVEVSELGRRLRDLSELHASGALTDEKFAAAKARVLGQPELVRAPFGHPVSGPGSIAQPASAGTQKTQPHPPTRSAGLQGHP